MPRRKKPKAQEPEGELHLEEIQVESNLDPHLQDVIITAQPGDTETVDRSAVLGTAEDGAVIVDVIAKLYDPALEVPGLTVVRTIGQIVTGTVRVDAIEAVRGHENVISLKRATQLHAELQFSLPEIRAAQEQLVAEIQNGTPYDGRTVIVGVVDYGCDLLHQNFRNPDGTTRLLALWDQQSPPSSESPVGYGYGREYDRAALNAAITAAAPLSGETAEQPQRAYQQLAYQPQASAHGTHVLDIAAGNGRATGAPGVAPAADLIFVHVAASDFEADESFGNSRRLLEAVDYVFQKAEQLGRPAVVNVSLGTHGGPHDGSTLVEQGFDELLRQPGRAIVVAAGNSRMRRSHASGAVNAGQPRALTWEIGLGDQTRNELEVWYDGGHKLHVTLVSPGGSRLGPVAPGSTQVIKSEEQIVGRIISRLNDPNNNDNQIDILLEPSLPRGAWQVELTTTAQEPVPFHAWIERDDFGQSAFAPADSDPSHTLGSIACGAQTIVVGSYNATVPARDVATESAEGPTRDGKEKPELSAPGVGIRAARSLSQGGTRKSGTSMAAPHVAGVVALLMQAAGPGLDNARIRQLLAAAARPTPPGVGGWHSQYGLGRVDALGALLEQRGPGAQPSTARPITVVATGPTALEPELDGAAFSRLFEALTRAANETGTRIRVEIEVEPARR